MEDMPNNKENVNNRVEGTSALQPDLQKGVEKSGKNVNVTDFDEYKKAQQNEANKGIKIIKDELINPIESKAKTGGNVNIGGDGSITIGGGRVIGGKEGGSGDRTKGGKKKNLGLRIAAGAMAGVVAISGGMYAGVENFRNMVNGWFGGNNVGPGEVPPPITTPGTMSSQEATPGVSLSPSATENMVSAEMQEKFAMAPEIDGLYKDIQEKDGIEKVVYLYESDNPYGGVEDEYAGEFKKEVMDTDPDTGEVKEVGGVVLNPDVVLYRWNDMYAFLAPWSHDTTGDWRESLYGKQMMIPLDISSMQEKDIINVSYVFDPILDYKVVVDFTGDSLFVVCPGKGEDNSYVITEIRDSGMLELRNLNAPDDLVVDGVYINYDSLNELSTKLMIINGDLIIDRSSYPDSILRAPFVEGVVFGQGMVQVKSHLEFYSYLGSGRGDSPDWGIQEELMRTKEGCLIFMRAN